ncbi:hypothetical protein [Ruminococcus sp. FC2018]|uniref:hypothetical protein n=1 Tax=Ruminococcus sp. FC2018 TaxID=1410617 RepID=UPI00048DDD6B|nr:hypothetical protein [Ruminococcus sp. FC2018]
MIVKNGANIMSQLIGNNTNSVPRGLLTKWDGTQTTSSESIILTLLRPDVFASNSGVTMKLGSGTTPVDFDDYCLESEIESTKYTCTSAGGSSSGGHPTVTDDGKVLYTFTFTANESITVNELCLLYFDSSGTKYMIARKIVPTRNAAAGETFTFSFVINGGGAQ